MSSFLQSTARNILATLAFSLPTCSFETSPCPAQEPVARVGATEASQEIQRIEYLITQLNSDKWQIRDLATKELIHNFSDATLLPILSTTNKLDCSSEVKFRILRIITERIVNEFKDRLIVAGNSNITSRPEFMQFELFVESLQNELAISRFNSDVSRAAEIAKILTNKAGILAEVNPLFLDISNSGVFINDILISRFYGFMLSETSNKPFCLTEYLKAYSDLSNNDNKICTLTEMFDMATQAELDLDTCSTLFPEAYWNEIREYLRNTQKQVFDSEYESLNISSRAVEHVAQFIFTCKVVLERDRNYSSELELYVSDMASALKNEDLNSAVQSFQSVEKVRFALIESSVQDLDAVKIKLLAIQISHLMTKSKDDLNLTNEEYKQIKKYFDSFLTADVENIPNESFADFTSTRDKLLLNSEDATQSLSRYIK